MAGVASSRCRRCRGPSQLGCSPEAGGLHPETENAARSREAGPDMQSLGRCGLEGLAHFWRRDARGMEPWYVVQTV